MQRKHFRHNSFIGKNYLFIINGCSTTDMEPFQDAEWLDLNDLNAKFEKITIINSKKDN